MSEERLLNVCLVQAPLEGLWKSAAPATQPHTSGCQRRAATIQYFFPQCSAFSVMWYDLSEWRKNVFRHHSYLLHYCFFFFPHSLFITLIQEGYFSLHMNPSPGSMIIIFCASNVCNMFSFSASLHLHVQYVEHGDKTAWGKEIEEDENSIHPKGKTVMWANILHTYGSWNTSRNAWMYKKTHLDTSTDIYKGEALDSFLPSNFMHFFWRKNKQPTRPWIQTRMMYVLAASSVLHP